MKILHFLEGDSNPQPVAFTVALLFPKKKIGHFQIQYTILIVVSIALKNNERNLHSVAYICRPQFPPNSRDIACRVSELKIKMYIYINILFPRVDIEPTTNRVYSRLK